MQTEQHTGCQTGPIVSAGTVHPQRKLHTDVFVRGTLVNVVVEVDSEGGLVEAMKHNKTRPNNQPSEGVERGVWFQT